MYLPCLVVMMTPPQLGHVMNLKLFYLHFCKTCSNKNWPMYKLYLAHYNHLWFYLHFCEIYTKQTWQHGRHVCNNFFLQVIMTLPFLGKEKSVYGFIPTYKHCNNQPWQDGKPRYTDILFQVMMALLSLAHLSNVYGFNFSSLSLTITKSRW